MPLSPANGVLSQQISAYPTLSVVTRLHSTDDYLPAHFAIVDCESTFPCAEAEQSQHSS